MTKQNSSRRDFLKTTGAAAAGVAGAGYFTNFGMAAEDKKAAADTVNFISIGVDGKGSSDSNDAGKHGNMVAFCDIDEKKWAKAVQRWPKAKRYTDYRKLLDDVADGKLGEIHACTVSTPDHNHAPASSRAMKAGLNCFTQKPLTHTIKEARILAELAAEKKLCTQMGNQGTAGSALREAAALIQAGGIGKVSEVHVFTNRPVWPQGDPAPEGGDAPDHIHWDEWIGPADIRKYSQLYHPFKWRGWWDFGTGALGDMACHTLNMPYMGADLKNPTSVQATTTGHNHQSYPKSSVITFQFPATEKRGPVKLVWYDGGEMPGREYFSKEVLDLLRSTDRKLRGKQNEARRGAIVIGDKGTIYTPGDYCGAYELWDTSKTRVDDATRKAATKDLEFVRSPGHFTEWVNAIKADKPEMAMSNFQNYAGGLTETILLGNLAVWMAPKAGEAGLKVEWDAKDLKATNSEEAQKIVNKQYREGWEL